VAVNKPVTVKKNCTVAEKKFARMVADGYSATEAARSIFGWKCEAKTREAQKARDLRMTARVKREIESIRDREKKLSQAQALVDATDNIDVDSLLRLSAERLEFIRDNDNLAAPTRLEAIKALRKINNPSQNKNLIMRYVDIVWRGMTAHCPCCHKDFAIERIKTKALTEFRKKNQIKEDILSKDATERKLRILSEAEKLRHPHETQMTILRAPERHVVGRGAARAGKSFLLAMYGLLFFLIPGVEIWILAKTFDTARSEFEYIKDFLKTLFYPIHDHVYDVTHDKKTGEASIVSKWGSEIRVRSGSATGSITGRELEAALVAEPAWVDEKLFDHLRARMSSRLGRIIALGTPQGFGGFLNRLIKMNERDIRTGRKLPVGSRLIENGCPWGNSMFILHMKPEDNPTYVKSELEAAHSELTATEYAGEFGGEMAVDERLLFPFFRDDHLVQFSRDQMNSCVFVLGVDQGQRNFGGCLIGWTGDEILVTGEYFDKTDMTIKANMVNLNRRTPVMIAGSGGNRKNWQLTIFDADPPVMNELIEMEEEGRKWNTDTVFRPKNIKELMNWREETYIFINELAKNNKILFDSEKAEELFEQLTEVLKKPDTEGKESKAGSDKGWIVNNPWRKDHVLDAFVLAMWTIRCGQLQVPEIYKEVSAEPWEEAEKAFEYNRRVSEDRELAGFKSDRPPNDDETFREIFGRPRHGGRSILAGKAGWYSDES
jgi:hypothetical protein